MNGENEKFDMHFFLICVINLWVVFNTTTQVKLFVLALTTLSHKKRDTVYTYYNRNFRRLANVTMNCVIMITGLALIAFPFILIKNAFF